MATLQMEVRHELPTVVVNCEQALLDEDGCVVAMVTWSDDGREIIYATDEQSLALVPRLSGDVNVADWVCDMRRAGRLIDYSNVVHRHPNVLHIDDARPEFKHGYRIYGGEQLYDGPHLESEAVYYRFVGDDTEDRSHRRRTSFHDVMALVLMPEAAPPITDLSDFWGNSYESPEAIELFGDLRGKICVEDEHQIQANIDAPRVA